MRLGKFYWLAYIYFQTILLGDSGVGKTSLLVQFDTGKFQQGTFSATVGIGFTVSPNSLYYFIKILRSKPGSLDNASSWSKSLLWTNYGNRGFTFQLALTRTSSFDLKAKKINQGITIYKGFSACVRPSETALLVQAPIQISLDKNYLYINPLHCY